MNFVFNDKNHLIFETCSQGIDINKAIDLECRNEKDSEMLKHFSEEIPKQSHVWSQFRHSQNKANGRCGKCPRIIHHDKR